ncbi:unnamed protein product [Pedinophyceae sp. YPF-701]|nr:unnamed protein product [Pedinophyceae sp. YPF-701]
MTSTGKGPRRRGTRAGGLWLATCAALVALAPTCSADTGFPVPSACTAENSYFDFAGLECRTCDPASQVAGESSCECRAGFADFFPGINGTGSLSLPTCQDCASQGLAASSLGPYCVACDATSGTSEMGSWASASFDAAAADCVCDGGASGEVTETDSVGAPFLVSGNRVKRCVLCPSNAVLADGRCVPCEYPKVVSSGACVCPATVPAGALCSDQPNDLSAATSLLGVGTTGDTAFQVSFFEVVSGTTATSARDVTLVSDAIRAGLGPAALACAQRGNATACSALANFCVLTDFDAQISTACALFNRIFDLRVAAGERYARRLMQKTDFPFPWARGMPLLYYPAEPDAAEVLRAEDVQSSFGFSSRGEFGPVEAGSRTGYLRLKAAAYALDGTYLGLEDVTDQLQVCGDVADKVSDWNRYGVHYNVECRVEVVQLLQRGTARGGGAVFYDLYLEDGEGRLYPVPIVNKSQRTNGALVNADVAPTQSALTRRLYVVDAAASVTASGGAPSIVRYARAAVLTVPAREDDRGLILPPYLTVEYGAVDTSSGDRATVAASFKVEYTSDLGAFWEAWEILLIVLTILSGAVWLGRMARVQRRLRSSTDMFGGEYSMVRAGIVELCDAGANALLIHTVALCVYWTFFYKLQEDPFVLAPTDDVVGDMRIVLIAALAGKSLAVLDLLLVQTSYNILLIDWERPRKVLLPGASSEGLAPTSAWRQVFVANEWNELASSRQSNPALTLFLVAVLLDGARWGGMGLLTPHEGDLKEHPHNETSFLLRTGIAALVWGLVLLASWVFRVLYKRFAANPPALMTDLCYMTNVSLVILDTPSSGYYIHGRSGMASADASLGELMAHIALEEASSIGSRGLTKGAAMQRQRDCQTFEVYLSPTTADAYRATLAREIGIQEAGEGDLAQVPLLKMLPKVSGKDARGAAQTAAQTASALAAQKHMCGIMKRALAEVEASGMEQVIEQTFTSTVLDIPPPVLPSRTSLVYDYKEKFMRTTLYGREWFVTAWEFMLFAALDAELHSFASAAAVTWFISWAFQQLHAQRASSNIAAKSMIGDKFFL